MGRAKETNQKEIGRIKLTGGTDLVASIVNDEHLDLRIWVDSDDYKGWTKQGLRFYLLDGNWEKFKEIMEKVDKEYEEIA